MSACNCKRCLCNDDYGSGNNWSSLRLVAIMLNQQGLNDYNDICAQSGGKRALWCMAGVLTLLGHSDFQALLQSTVLAAVASDLVDDAIFLPVTSVHHVLLDASPKEALRDGGRQMWTGVGEGSLIQEATLLRNEAIVLSSFKEGSQPRVRVCKSNLSKSQILKGLFCDII